MSKLLNRPAGRGLSAPVASCPLHGRLTDAKGNAITYTLDNMGNRVGEQVKDPQGNLQRSITRVYDALNRVQQVTGAAN